MCRSKHNFRPCGVWSVRVQRPVRLVRNDTRSAFVSFTVVLDMDNGTLSFLVDGKYLGVAFSGLKGRKLFPIVSTVWGHCEIKLTYMGALDRKYMATSLREHRLMPSNTVSGQPHSLKSLCKRFIRQNISVQFLEERVRAMDLPKSLYAYLSH